MGDRANIFMKEPYSENDSKGVYFYTHWTGDDLPNDLANALERGRGRWGDDAYLARIIFCELIKDSVDKTTGYGISTSIQDNTINRPVIEVDDEHQIVRLLYGTFDRKVIDGTDYTYEEFIKERPTWNTWKGWK